MPGALLHASSTPSRQLCGSSSLRVWGQLCIGLGFWFTAGSTPAPSGSTAHVHGPLPGSSGSTAASARELHLGCLVALLWARTSLSWSSLALLVHGSAPGPFRCLRPWRMLPLSCYWAGVLGSAPVGGMTGRLLSAVRGFRAALPSGV